jgi:CubicO group peptidase (beta-lactamase class C family)
MKNVVILLLVFGLSHGVAFADGSKATAASQSITQRVDKMFEKWDKTISPGCALAVMKDGKIVYKRGYGMADLDHNVPITSTTVFHVASMSKQFTAAAIVLLAQEGKLSLDDPVRKFISELPDFGVPITIRQLIHHTSGLRDQWDLLGLAGWRYSLDLITDNDVLSVFSRQKDLNFTPGSRHIYCNTGYTLLAQVVKRVSGQSFREFTSARIFQPLGMKETHFRDDHAEIVKNMAVGYEPTNETFRSSITNFDTVGATSLLTTVEDLALWDENFYQPRVGGSALVTQMLEKGRLKTGEQLDYAFGLSVGEHRGLSFVGHAGGDAGYRSDMTRFPDQHFTVACLCNVAAANPSNLTVEVAEIYLADKMQPAGTEKQDEKTAPVKLTESQLKNKVGLYLNYDGDQPIRVILKDGALRIMPTVEGESYELEPLTENRFRLKVAPLEFNFEGEGPGRKLRLALTVRSGKPEIYEAVPEYVPSPDDLKEVAGIYHSQEIDPLYRLSVDDGKLVNHRLKSEPDTLRAIARDLFGGRNASFRFTRDAQGRITGFMINSGRVRNLRFERGTCRGGHDGG